jgi:(1->4)-alpha-D-glucan 1-alpha-D-glucosylmutase
MKKDPPLDHEKVKAVFQRTAEEVISARRIPVATYRLQFNHRFTFSQAKAIVPYLHELGISHVYASPYFMARKGSLHGYDLLDQNRFNPEIGTEKDYQDWIEELKKHGMGHILDIVPNHMCITDEGNTWWQDVLENGPSSIYADYFDIDWKPVKDELENKVLLPILGDQYGRALENQELILKYEEGPFAVYYGDRKLPLDPTSYNRIFKFRLDSLTEMLGAGHSDLDELLSIITALEHLPRQTEKDPEKKAERRREKEIIKKRISALFEGNAAVRNFIDENITLFNGRKGDGPTFDQLDALLGDQAYRLSHWRVATEEINYRRFFDINELAAIRMESLPVFKQTHELIFKLVRNKKVGGLRVDHPDGLYNPVEYFYRLQRGCFTQICLKALEEETGRKKELSPEVETLSGELEGLYDETLSQDLSSPLRTPFYIIGEKILTKGEKIPEDWPIGGTVGYIFLNPLNGIFVETENAQSFERIYARFTKTRMNFTELVYEKKKLIMESALSGEVNTLAHYLDRLSEENRHTRDFTLNSLRTAIMEVIACFPVYRTYANYCAVNERDRRYIEQAVSKAKKKNPALSATIFDFLAQVLLLRYPEGFTETDKKDRLDFVMKFQQMTGPVMAKGLEDTVFYVYNRLISLNEVGGNPEKFGLPLEAFHGQNIERNKTWPFNLNTSSTHDTKRSEDVRGRINVLSEIPNDWRKWLSRWSRMNKKKKNLIDGQRVPDPNEEYYLYQTLMGTWPFPTEHETAPGVFKERIRGHMIKALREAKIHSSWINPDSGYEEALLHFIEALLSPSPANSFREDFEAAQEKIAYWGMFNSLSQTLLKITSPGIPDSYQGSELWDFSLSDPDNRRPVDFEIRQEMLKSMKEQIAQSGKDLTPLVKELLRNWRDGRIKLYITFQALNFRRKNHQLFTGDYIPLNGDGRLKKNLCALARRRGDQTVLAIVPRYLTQLVPGPDALPLGKVWEDSRIIIPDEIPGPAFRNILTGETLRVADGEGQRILPVEEVWANLPWAIMEML